ncbi:MAG TPA: hypothetical protein VN520_08345 [Streptomyces sp.]|uniref:hypothetical protein n=1 Tax=Streptomyces sp. TaxID=1931 RepID=UPI002C96C218|nr:hypothetical protein [Streptomyces sp.]HWU06377.1 hypothetical protein [Streptomyces sp.]
MSRFAVVMRAGLAAAALAAAVLTAPQAVAADRPEVSVTSEADAMTRALAQEDPQTAAAAATVCGTGYALSKAIPLPVGTDPDMRLATLFSYTNGGKGCAIMDNNVGASRYMYLKLCKVDGTGCGTDTGNFSQYAGPVYVSSIACAKVTARMGTSSSSLYIDYSSSYLFACN